MPHDLPPSNLSWDLEYVMRSMTLVLFKAIYWGITDITIKMQFDEFWHIYIYHIYVYIDHKIITTVKLMTLSKISKCFLIPLCNLLPPCIQFPMMVTFGKTIISQPGYWHLYSQDHLASLLYITPSIHLVYLTFITQGCLTSSPLIAFHASIPPPLCHSVICSPNL